MKLENDNKYLMPKPCYDTYIKTSMIEEKKSKFYSYIYYVETETEAKIIINKIKKQYKTATHIVFAYKFINTAKYSDDKEPKNTAGKPIYDILEKRKLVNILVVVIRYFGGTLLGRGLLLRTYMNACIKVIDNIELEEYVKFDIKEYIVDYKAEESLLKSLKEREEHVLEIARSEKVHVKVKIKNKT